METIKFGIIGCSRIAKRSVIPAIIKSEFAELEMIGSRTLEKAKDSLMNSIAKNLVLMKIPYQMIQLMRFTFQLQLELMKNGLSKQHLQGSMFIVKNLLRFHTLLHKK